MTVAVDGDTVTVSWDGRAVHDAHFFLMESGTGVWSVGAAQDPFLAPRHDPTIVPPLRYGQDVESAFVLSGPEPLNRGASYEVRINVRGWDTICEEYGIDVDQEASDNPSSDCHIADGRASFTF